MIKLYLAMAVLLIIAVIIVLLAGLRQRRQSVDRESENRDWYEQRLAELEQDKNKQRISQEKFEEAKLELDKTFISDSRDIEGEVTWKRANPFIPIAIILAIAVGFYAMFGSWSLQKQADDALAQLPELGQRLLQEQQQADVESMQTFALGMRQKLAAKPDDPMAWWLYARIMSDLRQFDQAQQAFEKSLALAPNRTGTLISYARFLMSSPTEERLRKAAGMLARVLQQQPTHIEALSLTGFVAYERGDWKQAIAAWQQLLPLLDNESQRSNAVQQAIADAQQKLQAADRSVTVTVSLGEQMRDQLPQQGTLFIYVTATQGPPMPAAVKRLAVTDWPVTVTLTDADSMLPDYRLSGLDQWQVKAMVSQDDKIDREAGDLFAEPMTINAQRSVEVALTLNQKVTEVAND